MATPWRTPIPEGLMTEHEKVAMQLFQKKPTFAEGPAAYEEWREQVEREIKRLSRKPGFHRKPFRLRALAGHAQRTMRPFNGAL